MLASEGPTVFYGLVGEYNEPPRVVKERADKPLHPVQLRFHRRHKPSANFSMPLASSVRPSERIDAERWLDWLTPAVASEEAHTQVVAVGLLFCYKGQTHPPAFPSGGTTLQHPITMKQFLVCAVFALEVAVAAAQGLVVQPVDSRVGLVGGPTGGMVSAPKLISLNDIIPTLDSTGNAKCCPIGTMHSGTKVIFLTPRYRNNQRRHELRIPRIERLSERYTPIRQPLCGRRAPVLRPRIALFRVIIETNQLHSRC